MDEPPTIPIDKLDHISIAVPSLDLASKFYIETFGCEVSDPIDLPNQKMRIAYVILSNVKIELMEATGPGSTLTKFLERNPAGGIHHFCLTTPDITVAAKGARAKEIKVIGDGVSHDNKNLFFMHPKDSLGSLIEIEENKKDI
jgi:methylmalonyl-CoA/ethylmalonyl-CoA epimerase